MKKAGLLLFTALILISSIRVDAQDKWDIALSYYRSDQYDKAIGIWDSIATREPSAAVWYNLGNAWYQKSDIPRAVLYYERALKWDRGYRSARENLEIARRAIEEPVPVIQPFFLVRWWKSLYGIFTSNTWALIFLIMFSGGIASMLLGMYGYLSSRLRNYLLVSSMLLSVISGAAAADAYADFVSRDTAVVLVDKVELYTSPDEKSPVLREFPGGTVVRITDQLDNWLLVVLPNMEQGWVREVEVERI